MTDCFDCMDPANYAAVALKLQETAFSAEACLFEAERSLRHAANLPTVIKTTTATQTINANLLTTLNLQTAPLTFTNSEYTMGNSSTFQVMPAGVWLIGCYLNAFTTGVTDDNTYRQLYLIMRRPFAPTSEPDKIKVTTSTFEAAQGSMDMMLCATVVADGTTVPFFQFQHGNTSSTVGIPAGCIYWCHRLSDQIALKAV